MKTEDELREVRRLRRILWNTLLSHEETIDEVDEVLAPLADQNDELRVALARWHLACGGRTDRRRRRDLAEACVHHDVYDARVAAFVARVDRRLSGAVEPRSMAHLHTVQHLWRSMIHRRNRLVEGNLGLVRLAIRRAGVGGELHDDLFHEGTLGLMRAMRRFDPDMGIRFSTYVMYSIRTAVHRAEMDQRTSVRVPSHVFARVRRIDALREAGRDPEQEVSAIQTLHAEVARRSNHITYATDFLPATTDVEASLDLEEHLDLLRAAISRLDDRERHVVTHRFELDGTPQVTYEHIGQSIGMSREGARLLQQRALDHLREMIETPRRGGERLHSMSGAVARPD